MHLFWSSNYFVFFPNLFVENGLQTSPHIEAWREKFRACATSAANYDHAYVHLRTMSTLCWFTGGSHAEMLFSTCFSGMRKCEFTLESFQVSSLTSRFISKPWYCLTNTDTVMESGQSFISTESNNNKDLNGAGGGFLFKIQMFL